MALALRRMGQDAETRFAGGLGMDQFKWKESFNIGVPEIDKQHHSFLDCLNECHPEVHGGDKAKISPALLKKLKDYAATHFRYEEEMLRSLNYPDIKSQEQQHKYFEKRLSEFCNAQSVCDSKQDESMFVFLRDWFLNHILEEDRSYVIFTNKTVRK
jgi:hemerythrin-like metal-binding protein